MDTEALKKFGELAKAIDNLEGIPIPYNIIRGSIIPLRDWLEGIGFKREGMGD